MGRHSNTLSAKAGLTKNATPASANFVGSTPVWKSCHPAVSVRTPEPFFLVDETPTISSRYFIASPTSSGSLPPNDVTFHVPRFNPWRRPLLAPKGPSRLSFRLRASSTTLVGRLAGPSLHALLCSFFGLCPARPQ